MDIQARTEKSIYGNDFCIKEVDKALFDGSIDAAVFRRYRWIEVAPNLAPTRDILNV